LAPIIASWSVAGANSRAARKPEEAHVAKKKISGKAPVESKGVGKKTAPAPPAPGAVPKKGAAPAFGARKK
jgi:hypothetical protein